MVAKLERHKMSISAVAFAPDCATVASGCANKEIVIWDVTVTHPDPDPNPNPNPNPKQR